MTVEVRHICGYLEQLAPLSLAEDWDNVGLLVGTADAPVRRLMTCLTVTPAAAAEAAEGEADLVVTHHPLPFRPLKRLTDESPAGASLLRLIRAGAAVYSAHTAFDSAARGINQQLAEAMGLRDIEPLAAPPDAPPGLGAGRHGRAAPGATVEATARRLCAALRLDGARLVGDPRRGIERAGAACGSGAELLDAARRAGCQLLVTGEASFHRCLEAEAAGVALVLLGHFASERFAMERLAEQLQAAFPEVTVWASRRERDPISWLPAAPGQP